MVAGVDLAGEVCESGEIVPLPHPSSAGRSNCFPLELPRLTASCGSLSLVSPAAPPDTSYAHIVKPVMRSGAEIAHGPLSGAEWLHVPPPYSSTALLALVSDLSHSAPEWHPRIVFEPAPTSCHPAELGAFERAAPHVEVLS